MEVNIKVLSGGYFVTVKNGDEIIEEIACSYGSWNLTKHLKKYLYPKDPAPVKKASKKKGAKKSGKKVNKRKL